MARLTHPNRTHRTYRAPAGPRRASDRATLGIVGAICGIVGLVALPIVFGPVAILCGWLAMNGRGFGRQPIPVIIALTLGIIVTVLAIIMLAGSRPGGLFI
ncbi:small hydrophobic protein [Streptomyces sp. A7024]|uniref:Small hydrophobic protein n=1 Tax=Streptomyces coryli TaxID=1128680 RepID=A0A6G4U1Z2_9ACTN|nr:small hydrophobic protein [Streptomyces coryli]NGN66103.1 small hydrophobic protein [Streptomyces coryli]